MVGHVLHVYSRKRARTHVEHDFVNRDSPFPNVLEEVRGEMKARGGSGDAARLAGVDGLVPLAIQRSVRAIDVGGERQVPDLLEKVQDPDVPFEFHGAGAVWMHGNDTALLMLSQGHDRAHLELAAGADQSAKRLIAIRLGEEIEHFGAAAPAGVAEKAGGQNPASIHDHEIALAKEVGQGRETSMLDDAAVPVEGQELRGVPVLERRLRYELRRQVEVEILRLQKSFFCGRSASGRSRPKCLYA
jgi:hypothetical protein